MVIASICPAGGVQLLLETKEIIKTSVEDPSRKHCGPNKTAYEFFGFDDQRYLIFGSSV